MANPKDFPPSNSSRGSTPPVSDAASSGKKNCYGVFFFAMVWSNTEANPEGNLGYYIRKAVITSIASTMSGWQWVNELAVADRMPSFGGTTSTYCGCLDGDKDTGGKAIEKSLKKTLEDVTKVMGKVDASMVAGTEFSVRDCGCGFFDKCSGYKEVKEFTDETGSPINDKSKGFIDSEGKKHDFDANSTRTEKMQKIMDAEKAAYFPCCDGDKKKKNTTTTAQKGTQLSTVITNLLDDN